MITTTTTWTWASTCLIINHRDISSSHTAESPFLVTHRPLSCFLSWLVPRLNDYLCTIYKVAGTPQADSAPVSHNKSLTKRYLDHWMDRRKNQTSSSTRTVHVLQSSSLSRVALDLCIPSPQYGLKSLALPLWLTPMTNTHLGQTVTHVPGRYRVLLLSGGLSSSIKLWCLLFRPQPALLSF